MLSLNGLGKLGIAAIISLYSISCVSAPSRDCGYIRNEFKKQVLWRKSNAITIVVPAKYAVPARAAAKTWNDSVKRELIVIKEGVLKSPAVDGINGIYFDADLAPQSEGITNIYWLGSTIYEADIRISGRYKHYWGTPSQPTDEETINLEALLLHEFGHVLGLDHDGDGVMKPYLSFFEDRISLTKQDISNIVCGYGKISEIMED